MTTLQAEVLTRWTNEQLASRGYNISTLHDLELSKPTLSILLDITGGSDESILVQSITDIIFKLFLQFDLKTNNSNYCSIIIDFINQLMLSKPDIFNNNSNIDSINNNNFTTILNLLIKYFLNIDVNNDIDTLMTICDEKLGISFLLLPSEITPETDEQSYVIYLAQFYKLYHVLQNNGDLNTVCNVSNRCRAFGEGLHTIYTNKQTGFVVIFPSDYIENAMAKNDGDFKIKVVITCSSDSNNIEISSSISKDCDNGLVNVSFVPINTGLYKILVFVEENEIYGSPFSPTLISNSQTSVEEKTDMVTTEKPIETNTETPIETNEITNTEQPQDSSHPLDTQDDEASQILLEAEEEAKRIREEAEAMKRTMEEEMIKIKQEHEEKLRHEQEEAKRRALEIASKKKAEAQEKAKKIRAEAEAMKKRIEEERQKRIQEEQERKRKEQERKAAEEAERKKRAAEERAKKMLAEAEALKKKIEEDRLKMQAERERAHREIEIAREKALEEEAQRELLAAQEENQRLIAEAELEKQKAEEEMARLQADEEERIAAEKKEEEERIAAEKKAEEEQIAAQLELQKAEEEMAKLRAEEEAQIAAEQKAEEERIAAEAKAREEKLLAEKKATEEKKLAAKKAAEEKRLALKKAEDAKRLAAKRAEEEKRLAAKKAEEERIAAEIKAADEHRIMESRKKEEQALKKLEDKKRAEEAKLRKAEEIEEINKNLNMLSGTAQINTSKSVKLPPPLPTKQPPSQKHKMNFHNPLPSSSSTEDTYRKLYESAEKKHPETSSSQVKITNTAASVHFPVSALPKSSAKPKTSPRLSNVLSHIDSAAHTDGYNSLYSQVTGKDTNEILRSSRTSSIAPEPKSKTPQNKPPPPGMPPPSHVLKQSSSDRFNPAVPPKPSMNSPKTVPSLPKSKPPPPSKRPPLMQRPSVEARNDDVQRCPDCNARIVNDRYCVKCGRNLEM